MTGRVCVLCSCIFSACWVVRARVVAQHGRGWVDVLVRACWCARAGARVLVRACWCARVLCARRCGARGCVRSCGAWSCARVTGASCVLACGSCVIGLRVW